VLPTPPYLHGAVEIAVGDFHACALQRDRTVACWGENWYGQLGDGTRHAATEPVPVRGVRDVRALAAGANDTCAILDDGQLVCWGRFDHGRL
jgi:alpha-tubulin suppressor-like RCC1 family protein